MLAKLLNKLIIQPFSTNLIYFYLNYSEFKIVPTIGYTKIESSTIN